MSSRIKDEVEKLFEFYCEVKILDNKPTAIATSLFPDNYKDKIFIDKEIPKFAFPCDFQITSIQKYSFVLTDIKSKFRFGFCRHDPETQTAMVVVTYLPWHVTFRKFLDVLGELRKRSDEEFRDFLTTVYKETVPDPGATLKIFYDNRESCFDQFQRPPQHYQLPKVLKDHNLTIYYNFVDPKEMISVFASMLAERRIIFTSSSLERLSCCVQAANEFLYPMQWQHVFVPILPMKLKDNLGAPMPYLIGVPLPVFNTIPKNELEEVVILHCDTKDFQSPFDDLKSMPPKIVQRMEHEFKIITRPNQDVGDRVSRIFLVALVQMIGGYRDALKYETGEKIKWDKDIFVARSSSAHMQDYLKKLVEIQIFNQFIDDRLYKLNAGLGITDEFENEVFRQAELFGKRHKGYKDIFRNVKDKTNPAMKTAVKTVKESSKGVKTAYKDLKSKLRDINPNQSTNFHSHISNSHHSGMDALSQTSMSCDFSAPNSPINTKRQNLLESSPISINSATDDSLSNNVHLHPNGYSKGSLSQTVSPASSFGSLNFNLTAELQDHPLFKSPKVDRSSPALPVDPSGDLMQLDDSAGSFEIEDFDPLNQNARPLPEKLYPTPLNSTSSNVFPAKQKSSSVNHNNLILNHNVNRTTNTDDLKLLSLYDLDGFLPQSSSASGNTTTWTTFD
ncbi:DENND1A family protein [Megaselia abdita]